jgi:hypothetical protein
MKKLLLIGIVLAICILAMPQGVLAATETSPVTVNALYAGNPLAFAAAEDVASGGWAWNLLVNNDNYKSPALKFTVTSSSNWNVLATATDGGFMKGSLGTLKQPFQMEVNQGGTATTVGSGLTVLHDYGPVAPNTIYKSAIWQSVGNDDFGSTTGYAITLTFTCTSDF